MRTLLTVFTHIRTEEQLTLLKAWQALDRALNFRQSDRNLLVIDSASPMKLPFDHLPEMWIISDDHIPIIALYGDSDIICRFRDNLGHSNDKGPDGSFGRGPDRAFVKALEIAMASGYDRFAYIEADLLCMRSLNDMFAMLDKPTGTPRCPSEHYDESGIFLAQVEYLWKIDFIKQYNWRGPWFTGDEGELRIMRILGDNRTILPLRGNRDKWQTSPDQLKTRYPDGLDFLTHAKPETLKEMLMQNGLGDCWPY